MKPLTNFDRLAHDQALKKFEDKKRKIDQKFCNGDITMKKRNASLAELKKEQTDYTQTSGIIQYFGKLFKAEK